MKCTKKWWKITQIKKSVNNLFKLDKLKYKRASSAGMFFTSSAGAVTSLIFIMLATISCSSNTYADYTISMTYSGAQSIDVIPASDGGVGTNIAEDEITVTTTCPSGYNLGISTSVSDNKLYLGGSSSATSYLSPSDGSTTLSSAANTWGYYYNSSGTAPTSSSVFSAIPNSSSATTFLTSSNTSDSFSVYYGVAVNSSLANGTYKLIKDSSSVDGTVNYYLTMAEACIPYTVKFDGNSSYAGGTVSGTMSDQLIYKDVATALTTNAYVDSGGYTFDGWNTAADGSGTSYTDGQSVTNLASPGGSITLYAQWKVTFQTLYDLVAAELKTNSTACTVTVDSKCAQDASALQATITAPTSTDSSTDTSNSGVFAYNSTVFGAASDAASTSTIYYYRGILDTNVGSYGSDGDNAAYPNTVVLSSASSSSSLTTSDTCWRIVRTTGSGGVKMIYQGKWTGSTCANATTSAQVTTSAYNGTSSTYRRIALVGYTYNPTYGDADVTTSTAVDTVFGSNSSYSGNSSNSTIKGYIENTWFTSISSYASKLEPSAGYCNDRTAYSDNTTSTSLSTIIPYATSSAAMYFGAYGRNVNATNAGKTPSLTCPSSRNVVDLYTTSSASNGNKQLTHPVALLTADEVSLAGSGRSTATQGSAYHANSFLRSGSPFWLLSPYYRSSFGSAVEFFLYSYGYLSFNYVYYAYGVRPAISLTSGTTPVSGSGTAADPWIVNP